MFKGQPHTVSALFRGLSVFVSFMQFENSIEPKTSDFPPDFFLLWKKNVYHYFLKKRDPPPPPRKKKWHSIFRNFFGWFFECFVCGNGVERQVFCPAERQYFLLYRKDCQVLGRRWRSPETNGAGYQWMREILTPSDWIPQDSIVLGCLVKLFGKEFMRVWFFVAEPEHTRTMNQGTNMRPACKCPFKVKKGLLMYTTWKIRWLARKSTMNESMYF